MCNIHGKVRRHLRRPVCRHSLCACSRGCGRRRRTRSSGSAGTAARWRRMSASATSMHATGANSLLATRRRCAVTPIALCARQVPPV
jgi:hypothetical protein